MNNNANLPEPKLVEQLARSVVFGRRERPDVQLLIDAIGDLLPPNWARELAATVVCHLDSGADIEDALGSVIERRMLHPETYYGWKDVTFARSIRIFAAMFRAWGTR
jgi:hypothetical protein